MGICLFYLLKNNRNRQLKLGDSALWASPRRGADRRGWEDLLRCYVADRSSKRRRGDVYAAGAVLDQGYVLPAINGSELSGGETISSATRTGGAITRSSSTAGRPAGSSTGPAGSTRNSRPHARHLTLADRFFANVLGRASRGTPSLAAQAAWASGNPDTNLVHPYWGCDQHWRPPTGSRCRSTGTSVPARPRGDPRRSPACWRPRCPSRPHGSAAGDRHRRATDDDKDQREGQEAIDDLFPRPEGQIGRYGVGGTGEAGEPWWRGR